MENELQLTQKYTEEI